MNTADTVEKEVRSLLVEPPGLPHIRVVRINFLPSYTRDQTVQFSFPLEDSRVKTLLSINPLCGRLVGALATIAGLRNVTMTQDYICLIIDEDFKWRVSLIVKEVIQRTAETLCPGERILINRHDITPVDTYFACHYKTK